MKKVLRKILIGVLSVFLIVFIIAAICDLYKMYVPDEEVVNVHVKYLIDELQLQNDDGSFVTIKSTGVFVNNKKEAKKLAEKLFIEEFGSVDHPPIQVVYIEDLDIWYCNGTLKRGLFEGVLGGTETVLFTSKGDVILIGKFQ